MIDLTKQPFNLSQKQIEQVDKIFQKMDSSQKIGQIFCPIGTVFEAAEIKKFIEKYQPGGLMYRPLEAKKIKKIHQTLQQNSKIPLLLAANLESGGNGICDEGTYFSRQMAVAASNNSNNAYNLGLVAGKEANAVGCNWSFAPIVDLDLNYRNPITNIRTYGNDPKKVIQFARKQIAALKENKVIPCIKHFPGDGVDDRDQHLLSSVNDLEVGQWDESYGKIYQQLINDGVSSIMVGHILMPNYVKYFNAKIKDEDILPASISKEILTDLLRKKLKFNGLIVSDATAMIGYNVALPRSKALPLTIENGCDMILFNKNIDEDYQFIKEALDNGLLSKKRLDEAVIRILATKMANGLFNDIIVNDLSVIGCKKHQSLAYQCASEAITLVKDKQNVLPISPQKYKRIRIYYLEDTSVGGFKEAGGKKELAIYLKKLGFEVDVFDYQNLNFYEIFEAGVQYFKEKYDLIIYVANFDTASNYTVRRIEWIKLMACDAPWFVHDIPVIFISMANPYHLLDVPMIKTYINCYSQSDICLEALVNKLTGKEPFIGKSPVDVYCNRWDTKR
ncbi:glycoside hydrolase family 3 N-terminal domain-containing protein [Thomasclavelia sp.]|uniref:glycoside hydrolase family 3 protein n=1 Tax=Thomasclavelia sp. TaxID=3025757 RepID=UPI0025DAF270|nr:glycoside hydrolase family 3 N-terminal domain-containing protein [Thomasclavelia sp.]